MTWRTLVGSVWAHKRTGATLTVTGDPSCSDGAYRYLAVRYAKRSGFITPSGLVAKYNRVETGRAGVEQESDQ